MQCGAVGAFLLGGAQRFEQVIHFSGFIAHVVAVVARNQQVTGIGGKINVEGGQAQIIAAGLELIPGFLIGEGFHLAFDAHLHQRIGNAVGHLHAHGVFLLLIYIKAQGV